VQERSTAAPQLSVALPETAADLPILRAAYSDRTAWLMASLARLAYTYPTDGRRGPRSDIPQDLAAYGFDRITYFHNGLTDGWAFIAEGRDLIVVAFRGTKSIRNWKTNFQMEMINPAGLTDPKLAVHKGFLQAFRALSNGEEGLKSAVERIKLESEGKIPIYLTGHSLGGALAQIATAVFGDDQIAACYTFGSPRVGNPYFDLWVKPPSYRIVNYADIVPQIPLIAPHLLLPLLYRHSGDPRYLPNSNQQSPYRYEPGLPTRLWQFGKGLLQLLATWKILAIEDHGIEHYVDKLSHAVAARSQSRSHKPTNVRAARHGAKAIGTVITKEQNGHLSIAARNRHSSV
jgi:hypothetical protein